MNPCAFWDTNLLIYWLEQPEVESLVVGLDDSGKLLLKVESVKERKALWRGRKRMTPPPQLPLGKNKYMGFDAGIFLASSEGSSEGNRLKGVPTSPGVVTGAALRGRVGMRQAVATRFLLADLEGRLRPTFRLAT